MAPGSALSVKVSIVNEGLDQSSPTVTKETRKGPKFKGGADLPDANKLIYLFIYLGRSLAGALFFLLILQT